MFRAILLLLAAILLGSGLHDMLGEWFGKENATLAMWIVIGAVIAAIIAFMTWRDLRARRDAGAIVAAFHKGQRGPFTTWFHSQKRWANGDNIPLGRVPGLVASAYNGFNRVAVLFREGFVEVIAHDLVAVLGDNERASRAYFELQQRTERRAISPLSIVMLLVAGKVIYDAARD